MGSSSSIFKEKTLSYQYELTVLNIEDTQYTNCVEETFAWIVNHCPRSSINDKKLCKDKKKWVLYLYTLPGFKYKKITNTNLKVEIIATLENLYNFFRTFYKWPVFNIDDLNKFFSIDNSWTFNISSIKSDNKIKDTIYINFYNISYPYEIVISQHFTNNIRITGHSEVITSLDEWVSDINKIVFDVGSMM